MPDCWSAVKECSLFIDARWHKLRLKNIKLNIISSYLSLQMPESSRSNSENYEIGDFLGMICDFLLGTLLGHGNRLDHFGSAVPADG